MSSDFKGFADLVRTMTGEAIDNYAITGLRSELIDQGTVRMFTQRTAQMNLITPHSHRYDFGCLVLSGNVKNILWKEVFEDEETDRPVHWMAVSKQEYSGVPGEYELTYQRQARFSTYNTFHREKEFYWMPATDIHSIEFEQGTQVLFFQGPQQFDCSVILEPMDDNDVIPIHDTLPWMFKKV